MCFRSWIIVYQGHQPLVLSRVRPQESRDRQHQVGNFRSCPPALIRDLGYSAVLVCAAILPEGDFLRAPFSTSL